jgi:hypothetical protein
MNTDLERMLLLVGGRRARGRVTRRRSHNTSRSSASASISSTSMETTSVLVCLSQPRAVKRGTPCRVTRSRSPVVCIRRRRQWSYCFCSRFLSDLPKCHVRLVLPTVKSATDRWSGEYSRAKVPIVVLNSMVIKKHPSSTRAKP